MITTSDELAHTRDATTFAQLFQSEETKNAMIIIDRTEILAGRFLDCIQDHIKQFGHSIDIFESSSNLDQALTSKFYHFVILCINNEGCVYSIAKSIHDWTERRLEYNRQFFASFGGTSNKHPSMQVLTLPPIQIISMSEGCKPTSFLNFVYSCRDLFAISPDADYVAEERKPIRRYRPLSVLAVDDSVVVLKLLSRTILSGGHHLDTASHGLEAIEKLKAKNFDVIILDIQMPHMNGLEAAAAIRRHEQDQVTAGVDE